MSAAFPLRPAPAAGADPGEPFLPYGRQSIGEDDIAAVAAVLRSDFLTTGPAVAAFERAFAAAVDAPHAIACANGTAALHLAMLALGVGHGDAVIAPTITFLATANCARFVGADVIFADVDPDTGLMTPDTLKDALARAKGLRVRAIIPVHLAGVHCDMAAIAAIAAEHHAFVVEDACHALGTIYPGGAVGDSRHADITVFSFHPVKTIATGEGGMLTTRDDALAAKLRQLRSHGMTRDENEFIAPDICRDVDGAPAPWAYEMHALGYNYRLCDIQAALGVSQLKKLDHFVARRRALLKRYAQALAPLAPRVRMTRAPEGTAPHLAVALIDFASAPRNVVMARLKAQGIGAQVHYIPVHRQPYYRALAEDELCLPGAEVFYARCLSLPLYADMADEDVTRVAAALAHALR